MAIDLVELYADVEVVYEHTDLRSLKEETLVYLRIRAGKEGHVLSESLVIVEGME